MEDPRVIFLYVEASSIRFSPDGDVSDGEAV